MMTQVTLMNLNKGDRVAIGSRCNGEVSSYITLIEEEGEHIFVLESDPNSEISGVVCAPDNNIVTFKLMPFEVCWVPPRVQTVYYDNIV